MQITLTDTGKLFSKGILDFIYRAESTALKKTIDKYSDTFIEALEYYGKNLKEAFEEEMKDGPLKG